MKILVTGGAGFIGSHVVERLLELSHQVVVLDMNKPGKVGHLLDRVELIEGDITRLKDCFEAVKGVDAVIHMAALIHVGHSIKTPIPFYETNVRGTMNLLEAVRNTPSVKKFTYMSTFECYGNVPQGKADETYLCDARSPYAASKYAAERYCLSWYATYGKPEVTIIRGANTYGPRQTYGAKGAVVAIFITKALRGEAPTIFGDGSQSRDFVYVKDMAKGIVDATLTLGLGGEIINLCSGKTVTVKEIALSVLRLTGFKLKPIYGEPRLGENMRSCGDPSKAWMLMKWKPETDFLHGLTETIKHYRENP